MKKISKSLLLKLPLISGVSIYSLAHYLYRYAFKRADPISQLDESMKPYESEYYYYLNWLQHYPQQELWQLKSRSHATKLVALWLPTSPLSSKTVIIAHGYKDNKETMANLAYMYHHLGFNVLIPDNRGHGANNSPYISFGWWDHYDYLVWLKLVQKRTGLNSQIYVHGVSMGGTISLLLSGEKLPSTVKGIISDCAFSSLLKEFEYLIRSKVKVPVKPLLKIIDQINQRKNGFSLTKVNPLNQLTKSKVPIFIIHGANDKYVPTAMAYENYQAIPHQRKLWIVPHAAHALAFWVNPQAYQQQVKSFIQETI